MAFTPYFGSQVSTHLLTTNFAGSAHSQPLKSVQHFKPQVLQRLYAVQSGRRTLQTAETDATPGIHAERIWHASDASHCLLL
jgi:hypothetical protein